MSNYESSASSFEEHWNSDFMKLMRISMLKNKPSNICKNCFENTAKSSQVLRKSYLKYLDDSYYQEIINSTSIDGSTTLIPTILDIRENYCNFNCRYCFPHLSSNVKAESIKNNIPVSFGEISSIDQLVFDIKKMKYIRFAGGEPFMSPIHWEVMDKLVETGNTNCDITYDTNLSFPGNTIDRAIKLLKQFQNLKINCSLDSIENDAEYIREGLDYQKFIENLKLIKKELPHANLGILTVITSLGLLNIDKLFLFCLENNLSITILELRRPENNFYLNICCLKPEVFNDLLIKLTKIEKIEKKIDFIKKMYVKPIVYDNSKLKSQELLRGKVGYFEKRMQGLLNE